MKFKVAKTPDLEPALSIVKGSLGSGEGLETHNLFRVRTKEDGTHYMEVLTHTGRIFSSCPFTAEVTADQVTMFTVDASRLRGFLDNIEDDAVLIFESNDGKTVSVSTQSGDDSAEYPSEDPGNFPFWDKLLEGAEVRATISAPQLAKTLEFSKMFAAQEESRKPELCVCEIRDGILASTDSNKAALIKVSALAKSTLRMHYRDAGGIMSFLDACGNSEVEILEYDRGVFFRCKGNGAVFGEGKFHAAFPNFGTPDPSDRCWWVLPVDPIRKGLGILRSAADKKDQVLTISRADANGPVTLSMTGLTGKPVKKNIPVIESGSAEGVEPFIGELDVRFDGFETLLKANGDNENIRIGVNQRKKGGYFRIIASPFKSNTDNGDEYLAVLKWSRS